MNITIDENLTKEFIEISAEERKDPLELIKNALDEYVYFFKINKIRNKLSGLAEKSGISSEDELMSIK